MNSTFKREQRYLVIKVKDAKYYLDKDQLEQLAGIADTIEVRRKAVGLPGLECVVIESHWPEYEATWKAIEARVTGAQAQPAPNDEYVGWYCTHCERGVDASEVTYHEQHEVCGRVITDDRPPKPEAQPAPSVPDVDALAQFIREIDGNNRMGAGALAERIVEWLAAAPEDKP